MEKLYDILAILYPSIISLQTQSNASVTNKKFQNSNIFWECYGHLNIMNPFEYSKSLPDKLSSPRAKRTDPKGLRAESARAVTGRQCPHSGEGEDFLARRPCFFLRKRL